MNIRTFTVPVLEAPDIGALNAMSPERCRTRQEAVPRGAESMIGARLALGRVAARIGAKVLGAVTEEQVAAVVAPLKGEAHGDAVGAVQPKFLGQAIVQFASLLGGQKRSDRVAPDRELGPVATMAVVNPQADNLQQILAQGGWA